MFLFFISFFTLEKFLNIYNPLENLPAYFKNTPINPVHPNLNITV